MGKFKAKFNGRLNGAIGVTYAHEITVEADSIEAAKLELYKTHEHISRLSLTDTQDTESQWFNDYYANSAGQSVVDDFESGNVKTIKL